MTRSLAIPRSVAKAVRLSDAKGGIDPWQAETKNETSSRSIGVAVIFTSAVQILGERLNLGCGEVGSILVVHTRDPAFSSFAYYRRGFYDEEEE